MRVFCADAYPDLAERVAVLLRACHPGSSTFRIRKQGCHEVVNAWKHWPCLFPQHGPGMKHTRPIVLADWQSTIVRRDPRPFIRGLVHSDGCRSLNTIRHHRNNSEVAYAYWRYQFTNVSRDIRGLFCWALDLLDIPWRQMNATTISVARREGVSRLDEFVGPKS